MQWRVQKHREGHSGNNSWADMRVMKRSERLFCNVQWNSRGERHRWRSGAPKCLTPSLVLSTFVDPFAHYLAIYALSSTLHSNRVIQGNQDFGLTFPLSKRCATKYTHFRELVAIEKRPLCIARKFVWTMKHVQPLQSTVLLWWRGISETILHNNKHSILTLLFCSPGHKNFLAGPIIHKISTPHTCVHW